MERTVVIENENSPFQDVSFNNEDYIGRGELGAIYRATATHNGVPVDVVVKVPHTVEKVREVEAELTIINSIRARMQDGGHIPVPVVVEGFLPDDGLKVMVMPYYDDADLLLRRVRNLVAEENLLEAERHAVKAAIVFARVMWSLHQGDNPQSCTDRKIKDFYALKDGQYVVIDWNVLREDTPEFQVGEIRLFGYLWHELFLERKGTAPYEPYNDLRWQPFGTRKDSKQERGAISVGLRVLLARAVDFTRERDGQPDFSQLENALEIWCEFLNSGAVVSRTTILKMLYTFPGNTLQPLMEEVDAIESDLKWRLGIESAEQRDEAVKKAREATDSGDRIRHSVLDAVERDPYEALTLIAEKLLPEVKKSRDQVNEGHLERWFILLNVVSNLNKAKYSTGENLSIRDRKEVEWNLLTVAHTLYRSPEDDDEEALQKAASHLEDVQKYYEIDIKGITRVSEEVKIRHTALKINREERIDALIQQIIEIASRAKNVPYLDPVSEDQDVAASADGKTLLRQIIQLYVLADFTQAVENLKSDAAVSQIYRIYGLALAAAQTDVTRGWIKATFEPYRELAAFIRYYEEAAKREYTPDTLRAVLALRDRLEPICKTLPQSDHWKKLIDTIARSFAENTRKKLQQIALSPDVTLEQVIEYRPYYVVLKNRPERERDIYNLSDFGNLVNFVDEWHSKLEELQRNPTSETANTLFELFGKYEKLGVKMSDLLGSGLLKKYREVIEDALDEALQQEIDKFETSAQKMQERLQRSQKQVSESVQQTRLSIETTSQNAVTTLKVLLQEHIHVLDEELRTLQSRQLETEVRKAIDNFDVNRLQELKSSNPELSQLLNDQINAVHELKDLQGPLQEFVYRINGSTYDRLREIRNMLREGRLPAPETAGFFTHQSVVEMARHNSLLRSIIDMYWTVRARAVDAEHTPLNVSIHSLSDEKAKEILNRLTKLYDHLKAGRISDLRQGVASLSTGADQLTGELLAQIGQIWLARATAFEYAEGQLKRLNQGIGDDMASITDPYTTMENVEKQIHGLIDILKTCPADAFSEELYKKWEQTQRQVLLSLTNLSTRTRLPADVQQRISVLKKYLEDSTKTAGGKAWEHTRIYQRQR